MSWGVGAWGTRAWGGGAPTITASSSAVTPAAVSGTGTVQSPLIVEAATPAVLAGTGTVQTPAVSTEYGPTPATIAGTGTVQSPTIVEAATPAVVAGTGTVQSPTVSAPPAVIAGVYAWGTRAWGGGAPISSAVSTQTPTPATIAGTGTVQSPTIVAVALPAVVAGTGTVQAPTGVGVALPAVIAGVGAVQSPSVSTAYGPTPDVITATGAVQSAVIAIVALPANVAGVGTVQSPSVSATTPPPPTPRGFNFQVWSMAATEPVLVAQRIVLPSSSTTAAISDAVGVELVSMGDRTGWYLAYDRGQSGSGKPTTLYAQLVHFDGAAITIGPEFAWDVVSHSLWRPSNLYQNFSHQIVGLSSTKAIRFWFQYDGSNLSIRAERIEFLSGTSEAPVVTDLGAIAGEPACGTSAASFWAQRTREGAAAIYWTEVIAGSVVVHIDGFIDTPSQWARLQPDPIVNTGVSAGSAPFHYGSIIAGDESYFSGLQTSPYRAAVSLDFIISSPGAGVQEIARRSKPSDYSLSQESLSGLADSSSVSPGSGSLEVDAAGGDQVLRLHLWSRFVNTASTEIDVTELTPYLGTLVAGSVNQYLPKKQVATSNAMFLGTWTDTDAHNQVDYINHARFPPPPRGVVNVAGHRQSMHSKTSVRT